MSRSYIQITQPLIRAAVNIFENPWFAFFVSGLVYTIVSIYSGQLFSHSEYPYYNYLADAFLHGQPWLRILPPNTHDLSLFNGRYYLYWAPFPAILLMPFVAIFGTQLNDVLYTLIVAAMNVGLVAQLLRVACNVEILNITKGQRAILVAFFAFGTVHFWLAPLGMVWMTGQLIGFTCTLLAYIAAFSCKGKKAWFICGLALAGAMLTRTQMVFTGIFPMVYLLSKEKPWKWGYVSKNLAWAALPVTIALIFYLYYNAIRFGSPFDVGLAYQNMADFFRTDYEKYGAFNLHYVPINLYYQYIFYPLPISEESTMGGSLFLLSPLFFGSFAALYKPRDKVNVFSLLASIFLTNIPILLLMGTGWVQFGPRYTLDFTVPLLLLTALGIEKWGEYIPLILMIASIFQYLIGVTAYV